MDEAEQDRRADMQLARQLLRAGVGQRHIRRTLRELGDHRDDLLRRMMVAGQERTAALGEARQLLGDQAELAAQMIARPELRSRARRFAWLLFGIAPLPLCLAAGLLAMLVGALILEVVKLLGVPPLTGRQAMAIGRPLLLWIVPCIVGLLLCWLAVRHCVAAFWPICAVAMVAWCSGLVYYGEMRGVITIAVGLPADFQGLVRARARVTTLFVVLGSSYLLLRAAQQRKLGNA